MTFRSTSAAALCVALSACASVSGGREPLVTDRPDFTESAQTIQPRSVQVEAGQTFTQEGDVKSLSVGEVLVRTGISKRVELRVSANSWLVERVGNVRNQGLEDGSLGVKIGILDAPDKPGPRPAVSLIAATSVPSGSANQRSSMLLPEAKLIGAWDLSERLAFSSNLNWASGDNDGQRFNEYSGTGSFGYSVTDRVGAYAEYFAFTTRLGGSWNRRQYVNGGLTFLFSPDLQLDARAGLGPHAGAHDFFAGIGISRRW